MEKSDSTDRQELRNKVLRHYEKIFNRQNNIEIIDFDLPIEIWCHILNFVCDYNDFIACKRVCWLFFHELKKKNALANVLGINWSQEVTSYFASRPPKSRATREQIKQAWIEQSNQDNKDYLFLSKAVLVGPMNAGKSTLRRTIQEARFSAQEPMLGTSRVCVEFVTKYVPNEDGVRVKFQILERFRQLNSSFFRGTSAILLCFAIDDRSTFVHLMEKTLPQCYTHREHLNDTHVYLLGLKADLEKKRAVTKDEAQMVASELKMKYFEISCKEYPQGNLEETLKVIAADVLSYFTWKRSNTEDELTIRKPAPRLDQPRVQSSLAITAVSILVALFALGVASLFR